MIAFTSCCGTPQAWVVHPDATGLRQVTTPVSGADFVTPVWSPDSKKLLLNEITGKTGRNLFPVLFGGGGPNPPAASLWTVNTDGSQPSKLADTPQPSLYEWGSAPTGG